MVAVAAHDSNDAAEGGGFFETGFVEPIDTEGQPIGFPGLRRGKMSGSGNGSPAQSNHGGEFR